MQILLDILKNRTISAKLKLTFFGFFFLIAMIMVTWLLSLHRENLLETEIDQCREIENSVLDMDRKLEKAKHLHRDFFLYHARIGLNEAHVEYAQPSIRLVSQAVGISSDLAKKISQTEINHSLKYSNVDLNLYLSSAKRFADTSIESIELLTRMVAPEYGLEPQFEKLAATLQQEATGSQKIKDQLHDIMAFYLQYKVTRQRHVLQSAFNIINVLQHQIKIPEFGSSAEAQRINMMLTSLEQLGQEILNTDSALKQVFNDFSLQEENVIPAAQALVEAAHQEVGHAKEKMLRSRQITFLLITTLISIALIWGVLTIRTINRSVISRIADLTGLAAQLRQGHLNVSVHDDSTDELGQLHRTFNMMVGRIKELVDDLELKIAQRTQQLAESERWLRHLFENSPLGIFRTSANGKVLLVNKDGANMLGCGTPEEVISNYSNMAEQVFVDPAVRMKEMELLQTEGEIKHFECQWQRQNGEIIWVSINARLTNDSSAATQDKEQIVDKFVLNITQRKLAEEENVKLEILNRQLHKNQSLARMAGAIAHHFNNQLGTVMGNLEMALEDLPQDAAPVTSLNAAMQGARKAADVSSLMLTYLGQTLGKRIALDLSEVCRRSLILLQAAAPKNVLFEIDLPSPGPTINADNNHINHVLTNLVTNAWEAIGENQGTVNLIVKMVSHADILEIHRYPIEWQPENEVYACVEVRDTGGGIAGADIDKLFDPFYSTKLTGRGLGLAVVFGIVKACGGAVTVESTVGEGSTFRVFLPVSADKVTKVTGITPPSLAGGGCGTVLLVEDEEMLREMAATMLIRIGYKVLTAKDGIEALEVFKDHVDEIQAVVSDLSMPRMGGWETLTVLRQIRLGIPVVLASGHDESTALAGHHLERPQVFLHKPYQKAKLQAAIEQAIRG